MKNQFVYFFKAINVTGIKIGMTTNEDLSQRLSALKISCPYGGEMVGYIRCENAAKKEKELHNRLSHLRLKGEWFDIDDNYVKMIINEECPNKNDLLIVVEKWINDGNDEKKLLRFLSLNDLNINTKGDNKLNKILEEFGDSVYNYSCKELKIKIEQIYKEMQGITLKKFGRLMTELGYKSKIVNRKGIHYRVYVKE